MKQTIKASQFSSLMYPLRDDPVTESQSCNPQAFDSFLSTNYKGSSTVVTVTITLRKNSEEIHLVRVVGSFAFGVTYPASFLYEIDSLSFK